MSNILAVQDSNNDLGIGTNSINLTSNNNFKFIDNNNHTYLQFNTTNNTIDLGTVKQSSWNGTPISVTYGGTSVSQLGNPNQLLSVKSDQSGLEFVNNLNDLSLLTNISNSAQNTIIMGNINCAFNINSSKNFKINSLPSHNQVLGYSNNSVKFIDETNVKSTDDLWTLMNIFYPNHQYLLMKLVVKKKNDSVNLIDFVSTKHNYTVTIINTSPIITIIPQVYNESKIELRHDVNSNDLNSYTTILTNSENDFTLTDSTNIISNFITCNFNFRISDYDQQVYTLQILQKKITVTITGYTDQSYNTQFNSGTYYNNSLYIKIQFSEVVTGFVEGLITKTPNCNITNFLQGNDASEYTLTLNSNGVLGSTSEIFIDSAKITDNKQNINQKSNTFSFIFDNVKPFMTISAYLSPDLVTNPIINNSIIFQSSLTNNTIYIKYVASMPTNDFIANMITDVPDNSIANFISIGGSNTEYSSHFICSSGVCSISVGSGNFTDANSNSNTNNASNTFTLTYDTSQ